MHATSAVLRLTLFGCVWLGMLCTGCSGPQSQHTGVSGAWTPSQPPPPKTASQLASFLAHLSELQAVSQDSLDAAKAVGTPEPDLAAAQRDFEAAEQLRFDGHAAFMAGQYKLTWDRLRAADAAFRRADEAAIRAGLSQLEQELAAHYDHLAPPDTGDERDISGAAQVSQGSINLRGGAGTQFQILGKAHVGALLTILAESGEWYQVRTGTGLVGWVSKILVTRVQNP